MVNSISQGGSTVEEITEEVCQTLSHGQADESRCAGGLTTNNHGDIVTIDDDDELENFEGLNSFESGHIVVSTAFRCWSHETQNS